MEKAESPARARFAALMERDEIPLAEAALAVAEEEYPGLHAAAYLAKLDRLGERVAGRLGTSSGPRAVLDAMKTVIFREEGFHGNEADYYDRRNSFLNEELDRRLGIPISLSILYVEVARRVGLGLLGVGFPGHFLVKSPAVGPTPLSFNQLLASAVFWPMRKITNSAGLITATPIRQTRRPLSRSF